MLTGRSPGWRITGSGSSSTELSRLGSVSASSIITVGSHSYRLAGPSTDERMEMLLAVLTLLTLLDSLDIVLSAVGVGSEGKLSLLTIDCGLGGRSIVCTLGLCSSDSDRGELIELSAVGVGERAGEGGDGGGSGLVGEADRVPETEADGGETGVSMLGTDEVMVGVGLLLGLRERVRTEALLIEGGLNRLAGDGMIRLSGLGAKIWLGTGAALLTDSETTLSVGSSSNDSGLMLVLALGVGRKPDVS
jgi:hypothetical protein